MAYPGYPPQGGQPGYPPQGGGYPPQGPYPPQGGYPPQAGGYPPQAGGYPPQAGGYPPQAGGYPPQAGGYPPQAGAFPAQGAYPPQGGAHTYYFIKHRASQLYLDIEGGSRNPGARVVLWNRKPSDNDNQLWYSDPPSGTVRSKLSDFCLSAEGLLVVKPFQPGDPSQQLEWADALIRSKQMPNRVLEVTGAGPGATLGSRDYNGNPNQLFEYELLPAGGVGGGGYPSTGASTQRRDFYIVSALNGKVLDIKNNSPAPETQVVMWSKNAGRAQNQLWYTDQQGNIRSALNDFAFIAPNDGEWIRMRPLTGDPKQQWYVDGQKILNRAGTCLDIRGSGTHDGAEVLSYKYGGGQNQHWRLEYA